MHKRKEIPAKSNDTTPQFPGRPVRGKRVVYNSLTGINVATVTTTDKKSGDTNQYDMGYFNLNSLPQQPIEQKKSSVEKMSVDFLLNETHANNQPVTDENSISTRFSRS